MANHTIQWLAFLIENLRLHLGSEASPAFYESSALGSASRPGKDLNLSNIARRKPIKTLSAHDC